MTTIPEPSPLSGADPSAPAAPAPDGAASGEAATAPAPAGPLYLPDGTRLLLTLSRKIWLGRLFGEEGSDAWAGPENPSQDLAVLYLAAHDPAVYMAPGIEPSSGRVLPLIQRPQALQSALDAWADGPALAGLTVPAMSRLAVDLWNAEHATQTTPVEKKSQELPTLTTNAACLPTGASST